MGWFGSVVGSPAGSSIGTLEVVIGTFGTFGTPDSSGSFGSFGVVIGSFGTLETSGTFGTPDSPDSLELLGAVTGPSDSLGPSGPSVAAWHRRASWGTACTSPYSRAASRDCTPELWSSAWSCAPLYASLPLPFPTSHTADSHTRSPPARHAPSHIP